MPRPKYPRPDENRPVRTFLAEWQRGEWDASRLRYTAKFRGQYLVFIDISRLPGQSDWLLLSDVGWYLVIEEKQPGHELDFTDGEEELSASIGLHVVTSADAVLRLVMENTE